MIIILNDTSLDDLFITNMPVGNNLFKKAAYNI